MEYIDISINKSQTYKVKDSSIRAQVWSACYEHLPVTFTEPEQVVKACKLEGVKFKDGSSAYRLRVPMFGHYYCTDWYK